MLYHYKRRSPKKNHSREPYVDRLEIIEQDVLKTKTKNLSGHSFEAVQTWVKTFKKTLGGQKFEELQALVDEIQKLASDKASAMPKERLKELAVKFGIPSCENTIPVAGQSGQVSVAKHDMYKALLDYFGSRHKKCVITLSCCFQLVNSLIVYSTYISSAEA